MLNTYIVDKLETGSSITIIRFFCVLLLSSIPWHVSTKYKTLIIVLSPSLNVLNTELPSSPLTIRYKPSSLHFVILKSIIPMSTNIVFIWLMDSSIFTMLCCSASIIAFCSSIRLWTCCFAVSHARILFSVEAFWLL